MPCDTSYRAALPLVRARIGSRVKFTDFVYTVFVKNVTISLDDHLLEKCREFARNQGKSFNELVRDLLRTTVDDRQEWLKEAWDYADRLHLRLDGPIPSREERNARS